MNKQLFIEGVIVGLSVIVMGTIVTYSFAKYSGKNTSFIWNPGMFLALFLTGFLLHIVYDYAGLNTLYCKMKK